MGRIKKYVRKAIFADGKSIKALLNSCIKEEACIKDTARVFLWAVWFVCMKYLSQLLTWILRFAGVIILLILFVFLVVLFVLLFFCSPVWYPFLMWLRPEKAAKLITEVDYSTKNEDFVDALLSTYWFAVDLVFGIVMNSVYSWTWKFMPMRKRQYYIDAARVNLATLSANEQVAYYDLQDTEAKPAIIHEKMSYEGRRALWERGNAKDIANTLENYTLAVSDGQSIFVKVQSGPCSTVALKNVLQGYCADRDKKLYPGLQLFFVEQLAESGTDVAYDVVMSCCNRPLESDTLVALVRLLSTDKANQAYNLLDFYWSKFSFADEVVKSLIMEATLADKESPLAFELFCKIVERDALTVEQAELFYESCANSTRKESRAWRDEIDGLIKMHIDLQHVRYNSDVEDNVIAWEQYCSLAEEISPEAQVKMVEWQYDIYHKLGKVLDKDVLYELLVKNISRKDASYFEKVMREENERNILSDDAGKLIMMVEWKRAIVMKLLEEEKNKCS